MRALLIVHVPLSITYDLTSTNVRGLKINIFYEEEPNSVTKLTP